MKLSYRGVSYENESLNLEFREGEIGGKYRGQEWKTHYPRHIPELKPKVYRQYRGVAYSSRPSIRTESDLETAKLCSCPLIVSTPQLPKNLEAIHRENLLRNLERRLDAAMTRGDQNLITLLEQELQQLTHV